MSMFKRSVQKFNEVMRGVCYAFAFALLAIFGAPAALASGEYLEPEAAFKFSARMIDEKTISVSYVIADGYYMYRERFAFKAEGARLGEPIVPAGKIKFDETFQKDVETHRKRITITLPVEAPGRFTLVATSQGCADKGLCYSPMESTAKLSPSGGSGFSDKIAAIQNALGGSADEPTFGGDLASQVNGSSNTERVFADQEMGSIEASLRSGSLLVILPLFLLLGLGLSFTPCVLPMVPILSSIIIGEGSQSKRMRGFILSLVYSLGMALVYTGLGVAAGLAGEGLAAALQNTWTLSVFAMVMVLLSLSMFGVYQLQMPASIQLKLMQASSGSRKGKLFNVFVMGALSALIVGPCVAAPLAGTLLYISQTRDVVIGGSALFAMAIGMSIPLLLIGASAGTLLPRTGAWMEAVKRFFGVLLLGVALWMISSLIPAWAQMAGWAALGIGYGAYLLTRHKSMWLPKAIGISLCILGAIQLVGISTGARDASNPLANFGGSPSHETKFIRVASIAELDAAVGSANGKTVMLDFYADWCVSCKEMEKFTFSDKRVQDHFGNMLLLQVDVTANNADDKALLKRFNLFGPPGIIFFDKNGREIQGGRVIGYQNADRFSQSLDLISQF